MKLGRLEIEFSLIPRKLTIKERLNNIDKNISFCRSELKWNDIYLDESETNEHLIIAGQTDAIDMYVDIKAKDGEGSVLALYSGSEKGYVSYSSGDILRLENKKQNADIRFKIDDGGVTTDLLALDAII